MHQQSSGFFPKNSHMNHLNAMLGSDGGQNPIYVPLSTRFDLNDLLMTWYFSIKLYLMTSL